MGAMRTCGMCLSEETEADPVQWYLIDGNMEEELHGTCATLLEESGEAGTVERLTAHLET